MKTLKNYKESFRKYWGFAPDETPMCWACLRRPGVDIHHLTNKGSHDLIIAYFTASWCGPCKLVKKALTDEVRERLNIEEIDVSKDPEKSAKHQILGVPTFVKIEDEKETFRKVGSMTVEELENLKKYKFYVNIM